MFRNISRAFSKPSKSSMGGISGDFSGALRRSYSSAPVKKSYKDLFNTSVLKSMFLMVCFGTVVVDVVKNRRELENLEESYVTKFNILEEVRDKLRMGIQVDLAKELKLANSLTHDISDIEFDEQLEKFFKMADEDAKVKDDVKEVKDDVVDTINSEPTHRIETSKFL